MNILDVAQRNQKKAWKIIEATNIIPIWEGVGAKNKSDRFPEYKITDAT